MSTVGFWREIRQDSRDINISSNRLGKLGRPWFVFPQGNGPRGSFSSMATLMPNLRSRDIVVLGGVLREQVVAPLDVYDVTIIGAANRPRQATTATGGVPAAGTPTGGGACWLPPASGALATTPLLELRAAGWSIENIEFSPVNASAAIRLTRSAVVDTIDSSHTTISGCLFGGNGGTTQNGVEDNGGASRVLIEGCRFEDLGNTAILSLNTAAAVPLGWQILRNVFRNNLNDIKMSLTDSLIEKNRFFAAGSGSVNKVISTIFISGQGNNNHVILNQFKNTEAQIQISNGYSGGSTDTWSNYAEGTAALIVTSPPGA